MDGLAPASAVLGRRLDRLRSHARPNARPWPTTRPDHARALADAVGGRVERTSAGAVVWLESQAEVAVDRGALRTLPYSVGTEQPFVCLDLETTGLATAAGTVAFLVGLGSWD